MCYVCNFEEPAVQLRAAYRLLAARADEARAEFILTHLGFKGLRLISNGDGKIVYKYGSYDEDRLNHMMGQPKADIGAPNIRYPYGVHGLLAVWPGKSQVLLRNTKSGKDSIEIPDVLQKEGPPPAVVLPNAGTENDDQGVPIVKISDRLHQDYLRCQTSPKYRKKFMQDLWLFFNAHKFGGTLTQPGFELMKDTGAQKMKTRGLWYPNRYELHINPNVFNASQNFFVEVFLHEMCHQAVTDHWAELTDAERKDNAAHKGHGTAWATWMKKVGLNPLRFDPNENSTYMKEDEKKAHDAKKAQWQISKDEATEKGLNLVKTIKFGQLVYVRTMKGLMHGIAICQVKKTPNSWAILDWKLTEDGVAHGQGFSWTIGDLRTVYEDPDKAPLTQYQIHNVEKLGKQIIAYYDEKKAERQALREARKQAREVDY